MKQLLQDALDCIKHDVTRTKMVETIHKLRTAIDSPEQEPVAYMTDDNRVSMRSTVETAMPNAAKVNFNIPLYTKPHQAAERYPLPDALYQESKDWVQSDYAERVEWLHSMYENQKAQTEMYVQMSQPVAELTDDEIDAAWRSVDYTVQYEQFKLDVARAVLAAQRGKA